MTRSFLFFNNVFSFPHLYKSYLKCLKNTRWKPQNQRFIQNDIKYLTQLYFELKNNKYKLSPTTIMNKIERGKLRHIRFYCFRDKIVQRCFCDYFLVPVFSKKLIYDCPAALKNRGITFALKRVCVHLNKAFKKYKANSFFILTIDISKYFESIDHTILINKYKPYILDPQLFNFLKMLINDNPKGVCLGSQISQISALFYLNEIDHFIKEVLHIKYYQRYMDDLYLIHNDKQYLYKCLNLLKNKFHRLNLYLNQKKTKVHYGKNGFSFLKVRWVITNNGKIISKITTNTFQSMKRKIKNDIDLTTVLPSWLDYQSRFTEHKRLLKFCKFWKIPIKIKKKKQ